MPMVKWEPWLEDRELFSTELPRWMQEFMERGGPKSMTPMLGKARPEEGVFVVPRIDLFEVKDALIAKVEVPGIEKEHVTVTVDGELLTIKGSLKTEHEVKEEEYYFAERATGGFVRTITLPFNVSESMVTATLRNGLLEIRLPKAVEAQARERTINIT